jgi:hypothetical protein
MLIYICTFISLFLSKPTFALDISDSSTLQWEKISAPGVKMMLKSKKYEDTFLSLMESNDEYDLKSFDSNVYIKGIPEVKAPLLNLLGISEFLINDSKVTKYPEAWQVEIQGTYLKRSKVKILYCEIHFFEKNQSTQKQLLIPSEIAAKVFDKDKTCLKLIKSGLSNIP